MAKNPLLSPITNPTRTTQPSKAVNQTSVYVPRTHNTFDMSYFHFKSQKYGQYEPFFVMEGVPGDQIPFSNSHNIRSKPFGAPMQSPMTIHKDYFLVPNYAIQPQTWDYIFRNPSQGDDVPVDAQNRFPVNFADGNSLIEELFDKLSYYMEMGDSVNVLMTLLHLELFCSSGSLLYNLGYKLNPLITVGDDTFTFDEFFDYTLSKIIIAFRFTVDNKTRIIGNSSALIDAGDDTFVYANSYACLSLIRNYPQYISDITVNNIDEGEFSLSGLHLAADGDVDTYIRMDRVCAYQLACSQFYVNPDVDIVYNSQLFRDNYLTYLRMVYRELNDVDLPIYFFEYNGISIPYDYFSTRYYQFVLQCIRDSHEGPDELTITTKLLRLSSLLNYLFGYQQTLKFGDYFTDSRTQPLGYGPEGSDEVAVMDDSVNIVDISQKVILQRFRNAVVKVGSSESEYLKKIYGEDLTPDFHYPKFIVHTQFGVNGDEINNTTSDDQGNIVMNLKSGEDSSVFNVDISVPCVLVGISHISLPRVYMQTKERHFFHEDRYDMFNPMLQFFGDQQIYSIERTSLPTDKENFGYHSRNAEYKQRFSQASGAFTNQLRAWAFVADSLQQSVRELVIVDNQSPEYLRENDFEFNRFLVRQTGLSLATGYHFIITYNNKCVCNRPIDINPSTL